MPKPSASQRAPLRIEPARSALRDRLRGKTRKFSVSDDKFAIPEEVRHDGVSLEWKRTSCYGQEDPFYIASLRQQGWEPMLAEDFPTLVPEGFNGPIIKEGMMLMGRPQELTDQANAELRKRAHQQIRDREAANGTTPTGTLPRPQVDLKGAPLGMQKQMMVPISVED